MKDKNPVILSTDAENSFHKIRHPFRTTLSKVVRGNIFQHKKAIEANPQLTSYLTWQVKASPPR